MGIEYIALIIAAVLAAASTGITVSANKANAKRLEDQRKEAMLREQYAADRAREQSDQRQKVADQIMDESIDRSSRARQEGAQDVLQEQRGASLQAEVGKMPVVYDAGDAQPAGIRGAFAGQRAEAIGDAGSYANTLARLGSYDDLAVANKIRNDDTWLDLQTLGDFAAGDQRRLRAERDAARRMADAPLGYSGWQIAGDILGGLSQAAGAYGSRPRAGSSSGGTGAGTGAAGQSGASSASSADIRRLYGWRV